MNHKISVSVGIPAHNEENNIANLLNSIIHQDPANYVLKNIYVVLDGSTDNTAQKVKTKQKEDARIILINDKKRKGKLKRLEYIYKRSQSDILLCFDGDVIPADSHFISEIVNSFTKNNASLVGTYARPVKSKTFTGNILLGWNKVWLRAKMKYRNGNNLYNFKGCSLALRKDFYKQIRHFPKNIISDSQYIYLLAKSLKLNTLFNKKAIVLYRKPENLIDYYSQLNRTYQEKDKLIKIFGDWVNREYSIPPHIKYPALAAQFVSDPLYTALGTLLFLYDTYFHKNKTYFENKNYWQTTPTTKGEINF